MKQLILSITLLLLLSCSDDTCESKTLEIKNRYEQEIQLVVHSNLSSEAKNKKVTALINEMNRRISDACK